ncbi:hypothetical protein BG015_003519 [Linnemannia schmuckeri]|uniref:Uncharacterized protein n=1 Tax=Linnemannia schmuckeri TaxID=64567 RepID=A0A9P5V459_9FUNG|nr:hypothetical protein BG015_003519 [Linnemannia schmuckeri]
MKVRETAETMIVTVRASATKIAIKNRQKRKRPAPHGEDKEISMSNNTSHVKVVESRNVAKCTSTILESHDK